MQNIIRIEKLNKKGQGITSENPKLQIWNALPNELVEYEAIKNKKGKKECIARTILEKSEFRIEPIEFDHYLSCSPLQICDFEFENNFKLESTKAKFEVEDIELSEVQIVSEVDKLYGYRNKMEYSFYIDDNERISIAFFVRGSHRGKIPIDGCKLAHPNINVVASQIVEWINNEKIPFKILKSLILRSNSIGEVIAGLFVKSEDEFTSLPDLSAMFKGFQIFYSNPKSPASVNDKVLNSIGENFLADKILGKELKFGLFSFFQVNVNLFERVIEDINKFINSDETVIDLYSGVGSIGISISENVKSVKLVEVVEEASAFAQLNIEQNQIKNIDNICAKSEQMLDLIENDSVVIVDPPREGLHKKLVEKIREIKPKRIVYLSCNPDTQVVDIKQLLDFYQIEFSRFYNFFPRTIHTESLIVLNRK
jgi:23S rRNA (uracil1939-C5)-methyltransferase